MARMPFFSDQETALRELLQTDGEGAARSDQDELHPVAADAPVHG